MSAPLFPSDGTVMASARALLRRMFAVAANDRADVAAGPDLRSLVRGFFQSARPTARSGMPGHVPAFQRTAPGAFYSRSGRAPVPALAGCGGRAGGVAVAPPARHAVFAPCACGPP